MKILIILFAISLFPISSVLKAQDSLIHNPGLFLLDKGTLDLTKISIESGKASSSVQYQELLRVSKKLLKVKPHSIMEKSQIPPSGNKHDYMSLGVYWWPDSHSENGEPYIRKDGERNPEALDYTDHNFFSQTNEGIFNLSLAYYLSSNEDYAIKAVEFLRVWYLNPDTKMNPNLNFAQAVKGKNTGRGAGVLDGRSIAFMIEGLGLIDNSPSLTPHDRKEIHQWLTDYRTWLLESKNGKSELNAKNNHGTWFDVQMMSVSLYLGLTGYAKEYAERLKTKRIDYQIESDGKQPEELIRTKALHYSWFNLEAIVLFAAIAKNIGLDYWNYVSADGRSIKKAIEYLYPFTAGDETWPYKQITPLGSGSAATVLIYAYKFYGDKKYLDLAVKLDGQKLKSHYEIFYLF
jgi:hypothetical protein